MSNKPYDKLDPVDALLRTTLPVGMFDGTLLTIRMIMGFELFNTRPYHNYENWSTGYVVEGQGIIAKAEDLDDAVRFWVDKWKESGKTKYEKDGDNANNQ